MADSSTEAHMAGTTSAQPQPEYGAQPWLDLVKDAEKCFEAYHTKCDNIDKLYGDLKSLGTDNADREFQIFWANLEVLKPSIYSRPPVPVVVPRFKNYKPLPRKASELLERALITSFEVEDINDTMMLVRDDVAIHSRGVVWLRYEQKEDGYECVHYDHVDRNDFVHDPVRKWKEVGWVARRSWLTRKQMELRFAESAAKTGADLSQAQYKEQPADKDEAYKGEKKAPVWELWHKVKRTVVWIAPGITEVLDIQPPFLDLEGFFPCPRPAYGTLQRKTLTPVPDFVYYKDQVEEINELTARISALAEKLKVKGFYPGGAGELSDAIEAAMSDNDNRATLVPVSGFAALGGASLKESIVWLPVKEIAEVIVQLIALRRQIIDDVYQITGLSDIMRGETDPNETLGAQELKSEYGSVRIRQKQGELIRVARDCTRLAAEIMAENFQPETLLQFSQMQEDIPTEQMVQQQIMQQVQQIDQMLAQAKADPRIMQAVQQNPQMAQQVLAKAQEQKQQIAQQAQQTITVEKVIGLLREQRTRPFVLDIETDSTIQPDENAEKQRRTEFITAVGGFINQVGPIVQVMPEMGQLAADMLKFVAAGFRAGRELEQTIEQFAEQVKQKASQPPPPSPEQQKAEADAQAQKQKMEAEQAKAGMDMQSKQADMAMEKEKHAMELEKMKLELVVKREELQMKREEISLKEREMHVNAEMAQRKATLNAEAMEHKADVSKRMMDDKANAAKEQPKKQAA